MKKIIIALVLGAFFTSMAAANCVSYIGSDGGRKYKCSAEYAKQKLPVPKADEPAPFLPGVPILKMGERYWVYQDDAKGRIVQCQRTGDLIDCW